MPSSYDRNKGPRGERRGGPERKPGQRSEVPFARYREAPPSKRPGASFGQRTEEAGPRRPSHGPSQRQDAPGGRRPAPSFGQRSEESGQRRDAPGGRRPAPSFSQRTEESGQRRPPYAPSQRQDAPGGRRPSPSFSRRSDAPPMRRPEPPPAVRPPMDGEEQMPRENVLSGRNPIREAIKSGRDIERLLVARGELSGSAREIVAMARENRIVVQTVERSRLDEITMHHQGMIAFASAFRYSQLEDMLALAAERGEDPLLVLLDGVTDPHNLGAIIRSAECAGAHGVIVPERRAVGLTPSAVKASAGAVEYLPVARAGNLTRLIGQLKEKGIWIAAADMGGENYTGVNLKGPLAVVIGAEGSGVSRLVLEHCDLKVALPVRGKIDSLNASVAAGVLLYEVRRQRG